MTRNAASLDDMPLPALLRPRRGARGARLLCRAHALAPDEARTTSVGSTPTTRGSASEPSIRSRRSSAAIRARSAEPRSTVVSGGHTSSESGVLSIPTSATSPGTSRPASWSAASAPTASRSFVQRIASGRARARRRRGRLAAGLDHEVGRDLGQAVVAPQVAAAQAVEVAEPPLRAGNGVLRPVQERDPPAPGRVEVAHRLGGALARVGADDVDAELVARAPDHDDRGRSVPELVDMRVRDVERREDQPVREAVPQVAHDRELVVRVGARGVEHQAPAALARRLLDRRDHRRVDRVADVRHREHDLARPPRAERARGRVGHVADRLGGLRHAGEGLRARPDPVERARRRRDRDVREPRDRRDRRGPFVGFALCRFRFGHVAFCKGLPRTFTGSRRCHTMPGDVKLVDEEERGSCPRSGSIR